MSLEEKITDQEAATLSGLLDELRESTQRAHTSLDKGLSNLNTVLDHLQGKRANDLYQGR